MARVTKERLDNALRNPIVKAWLDTIAASEIGSASNTGGYNVAFGKGATFDSYADHPGIYGQYRGADGKLRKSSAAGRYQFLQSTWNDLKKRYPEILTDFSPENQDRAALLLAMDVGALEDMESGNFDAAYQKLGKRWASLPTSTHDRNLHGTRSEEFVRNTYNAALERYGKGMNLPRASLPTSTNTATTPTFPTGNLQMPGNYSGDAVRQMLQQRYSRRRPLAIAPGPLTPETGAALMNTLFRPAEGTPVHPWPSQHIDEPTLVQQLPVSRTGTVVRIAPPATGAPSLETGGPIDTPTFHLAPPQSVQTSGIESRDLPPSLEAGMASLLADPRSQAAELIPASTPEDYLAQQLHAAGVVEGPDEDFLKVAALEMPYRDALMQLIERTPVHDFA
ncbi:MAG: glycoside hydrolase family 104 protein [Methanocorpusculum sp.]|nr:glycoside hydrolase family 104 protein [Methanocorpusculum sp.]